MHSITRFQGVLHHRLSTSGCENSSRMDDFTVIGSNFSHGVDVLKACQMRHLPIECPVFARFSLSSGRVINCPSYGLRWAGASNWLLWGLPSARKRMIHPLRIRFRRKFSTLVPNHLWNEADCANTNQKLKPIMSNDAFPSCVPCNYRWIESHRPQGVILSEDQGKANWSDASTSYDWFPWQKGPDLFACFLSQMFIKNIIRFFVSPYR